MSRATSADESRLTQGDERRERYVLVERDGPGGLPAGLLVAGVAAVGLGLLAWYYLGPDLQRYMKIRNM